MNLLGTKGSKDTLTIYNWGEYIDPELIDQFEEETGINVIYETFDSNEAMYDKSSTRWFMLMISPFLLNIRLKR